MKRILVIAVIALASILVYKSCSDADVHKTTLKEQTDLIQLQLQNTSKLIVTEGHFAEVYNYADSKELFGNLITADKKALVVVNAQVSVAYDLKQMAFEIDSIEKAVIVKNIPEPEIKINPDFEYYDVSSDYFNPFGADDYNAIKKTINTSLQTKIEKSDLISNAENRLMGELSQLFFLTKGMGWKLVYQQTPVDDLNGLQLFLD